MYVCVWLVCRFAVGTMPQKVLVALHAILGSTLGTALQLGTLLATVAPPLL